MTAHPNIPAAVTYLTRQANAGGYGIETLQRNGVRETKGGYAVYFTVLLYDTSAASLIKVCENRRGRVTGATNVSAGGASCD